VGEKAPRVGSFSGLKRYVPQARGPRRPGRLCGRGGAEARGEEEIKVETRLRLDGDRDEMGERVMGAEGR
jgi:hypothetical protein